jgi:hypothetical protein
MARPRVCQYEGYGSEDWATIPQYGEPAKGGRRLVTHIRLLSLNSLEGLFYTSSASLNA